jgi:predicted RNase H-like HicB family nuclease
MTAVMFGAIEVRQSYVIMTFYSDEDEGFIAVVPELPVCSTFGETEEEVFTEMKVAIDLWIETAWEEGWETPESGGWEIFAGKEIVRERMGLSLFLRNEKGSLPQTIRHL